MKVAVGYFAPSCAPLEIARRFAALVLITACLAILPGVADAQQDGAWSGIASGVDVVLMRHARAPGTGDPDHFALGDCSTQRNLSATGRQQATRIGDRFRANGITQARVYSSQWCRCRDTAEALALGPVVELPVLNSFFRDFSREATQTQALRHWLAEQSRDMPLVLVTHQVNITALTGVVPSSGEMIIVRRDATGVLKVVGRITTE